MTINEYIQQEAEKEYPILPFSLKNDKLNKARYSGLSKGLDIGMKFAEWCKKDGKKFNDNGKLWRLRSDIFQLYTTKQLLEIFIDHLNKKG